MTQDDLGKDGRKNSISFRRGSIQCEACGRKQKWPNLRYSLGFSPDWLRKSTINPSHDRRSRGQIFTPRPPEYESRATNHWNANVICFYTHKWNIILNSPMTLKSANMKYLYTKPNTLAQSVTLLTCTQEAPGSSLGRDDYADWCFCDFPQSLQANASLVCQIRKRPLPSTSLPIHYSILI
jgi:hypothetical protein